MKMVKIEYKNILLVLIMEPKNKEILGFPYLIKYSFFIRIKNFFVFFESQINNRFCQIIFTR